MTESRIVLDGEYDLSRKAEVAALFASVDGDGALVIDMAQLSYLDSSVLGELWLLRKRYADRDIRLTGVKANIRRILDIAGFDEVFQIG